jgi:hypothetical protein
MKYAFILVFNNLISISIFSQKIEINSILERSDSIKNFNVTMEIPKFLSKEMNSTLEKLFLNQFEKYVAEVELIREQELEDDNRVAGPGAEYRNFTIDVFYKVFDIVYVENDIYIVYNQKFESQYSGTAETPHEDHFVKILRLGDINNEIKIKPIKSLFLDDINCDGFFSLMPSWLPECSKAKFNNFSWNLIGKSILNKDKVMVYVDNTFFEFKKYEDEENDCGSYPSIFGTIKKVEIELDDKLIKYIKPKTIIKTQKSFFYSAPNKLKKMYLIKGDEVEVIKLSTHEPINNIHFNDGYINVRYYGKRTIEGWIKKSDVE